MKTMQDCKVQIENWNGLLFASLFPEMSTNDLLRGITERIPWFPFDQLKLRMDLSQDYEIQANWSKENDQTNQSKKKVFCIFRKNPFCYYKY